MQPNRRDLLLQFTSLAACMCHPGLRVFANANVASTLEASETKNRFLSGNFAPQRIESDHEKLKVIGAIPKGMRGDFLRNGPNPQFDPIGNYHWFDGDGMIHRVRIRDGQASYCNRFVQTTGYLSERKAGKATYRGILDPPDVSKLLAGKVPFKNASNTSLVYHANRLLSLWEAGEPYEIRAEDLTTIGPMTWDNTLTHPFTAHPKLDPRTGELLAFGYIPTMSALMLTCFDPHGGILSSVKVPTPKPVMVHDFAITENYVIFPLCPQVFDATRMLGGKVPWHFNEKEPTRFAVVSRRDQKKVQLFEAETCFAFHFLNAFENNNAIELIGSRYQRFPGSLNFGDEKDAGASDLAVPYRWRLHLENASVNEEVIEDLATEFPRINEQFTGVANRYGYFGIGEGDFFNGFRKYDFQSSAHKRILFPEGCFGGEGVFVPYLDAANEEDAGWLLTYVYDKNRDKSELWIIDARDFDGPPVARIEIPTRVPYGFHGIWIPENETI